MESKDRQDGFTLVELLVVIGIMSLLAAGIAVVGSKVRQGAQIKATKTTMSLLCSALCEYQNVKDIGSGFAFPVEPEVYDFSNGNAVRPFGLIEALQAYLPQVSTTTIHSGQHNIFTWKDDLQPDERRYALTTIEFIYAVLEDVPQCRAILEKLPQDRVVNADNDSMSILDPSGNIIAAKALLEVNDAWGHPLWYTVRGAIQPNPQPLASGVVLDNFPMTVSAGPDGLFGTEDDITSSGK